MNNKIKLSDYKQILIAVVIFIILNFAFGVLLSTFFKILGFSSCDLTQTYYEE